MKPGPGPSPPRAALPDSSPGQEPPLLLPHRAKLSQAELKEKEDPGARMKGRSQYPPRTLTAWRVELDGTTGTEADTKRDT